MDEFYGSAVAYEAYHVARGRTVTATSDEIEAALLISSDWLDAALRSSIPGYKVDGADQWREWPRIGVIDRYGYAVSSESVPIAITYAVYELALRELATPGALTKDFTPARYKRVSVEGAVSVEYANVSAADVQTQFPVVWQILGMLLDFSYGFSSLSGKIARA